MDTPGLIIFDGDDTLWISEVLYDRARLKARSVVANAGLDGAVWEELQRRVDVENVELLGLSAERFPLSCRQAYESLAGESLETEVAEAVQAAARSVFCDRAELAPDVVHVLRRSGEIAPLALLTKGDPSVQIKRIADSGLSDFFETTIIVSSKSTSTFAGIALSHGIETARCWSVGNSLRSDIQPALSAGMRGFWLDAHVWEYERNLNEDKIVDEELFRQISSLSELTRYFD